MFRHFAVLTLAITGLLAMFAGGENREAFEQQLAQNQENKKLKEAELEMAKQGKGGNTGLIFKDNRRRKVGWASDRRYPGVNVVPTEGEGSPELGASSSPRFIDLPSRVGEPSGQPTVAPPGMTGQDIVVLQTKKKKLAKKDAVVRRPPPTEESEADY
jgi:hypothetical protein